MFAEVWEFHKANFKNNETFFPENYALLFGKSFSDLLKKECYDVIICRDYFFSAYLVSDVRKHSANPVFPPLKVLPSFA